jgi:UDP-glucose 4-epimerase
MVWELLDAGDDVVVVDRLSTGFKSAVAPEANLIVGDIGDAELISKTIRSNKVDAIIHFAGSVVVPESVADPLVYYENNTTKTRTLIETAVKCGVAHFIFSSTAAVYGSDSSEPVDENAPLAPQSPYGRSKLMTEWMLSDAGAAHRLTYTILRYFNVAGADPRGRTGQSTRGATHLIKVACETALGKRPFMEVFGTNYSTPDGTCIRDFIHVTDLVVAHRLALKRLRGGGKSLLANCGYGHGHSVLEVIDTVRRVYGTDFEVRIAPPRVGDSICVVANPTRAKMELNWTPEHNNLDGIIRDALRWEGGSSRCNASQ